MTDLALPDRPLTDLLNGYRRMSGWEGPVQFIMRSDEFAQVQLEARECGYRVGFNDLCPPGQILCLPVDE